VVDTLLIDQDIVHVPRLSKDRLWLGLKGSLNECELDLLRQRFLDARYEKARRTRLVTVSPAGYRKTSAIATSSNSQSSASTKPGTF